MRYLSCFFLLIVLFSCQPDGDDSVYTLQPIKEVSLPLDQFTDNQPLTLKYFDNGEKEYLYWVNKPLNRILIYDLNEAKLVKELKFARKGPNSIREISGLTILGPDNIIIDSNTPGKLLQIDQSGTIQDVLTFSGEELALNNIVNIRSNFKNDVYRLKNGELIVPNRFPYLDQPPSEEELKQYPLFTMVNPNDNTFQGLPIYLPFDYFSDGMPTFTKTSCFDGQAIYYSFECTNRVYKTDDFENIQSSRVASQYAPQRFEPFYRSEPFRYFSENFTYRNLFFDSYRNVFYRIAKLPYNEKVPDMQKEFEYPTNFSVIIFNKKLEVLGETTFRNEKLSMDNMFVGRDGLYISTAHPDHPNLKENEVTFKVYTF